MKVQERLARDDRCLHMTFSVIVDGGSDEEIDERTRQLVSVFQNDLECEVIVEEDIGLGLVFNALPLCYSPKTDYSTRRFIRILRSDATRFLPVFDSFRGLKTPVQLYLSRENNLIPFSLTENETSNHTVVLADSGSGKSAFVIDCIQAVKKLDPEPLVFVIDKGTSYLTVSKYYDANLEVFGVKGECPFNPFRGVYDEDKVSFLTNLVISGVKMLSPSFEIDSEHFAALGKAIRLAYERKSGERGLTYKEGELVRSASNEDLAISMDDVVVELSSIPALDKFEKFAPAIEALTPKLAPFYGDGQYASYFRTTKDKGKKFSSLFYVYDMEGLDSDPVLREMMTMAVIEEIRQTIKRQEHEGRQAFVVLEEMQNLAANNPYGKQFVIDAAERFRKLGVWLIALTPRPQNYFETEAGQALWGVADNFIFLQMSADNVEYLLKHSSMFDEANSEIIKSLRTVRGKFADIFYMNKKKTRQGAFKFTQTPLDRWLAPTNAEDGLLVKKTLKRFDGDKWAALDYLAKNYPGGETT